MARVLVIGASLGAALPVHASAQGVPAGAGDERVRPGDVVRIKIWREEDMSGDFPVSAEGVVVIPKLGPFTVSDRTASALRDKLLEEYHKVLRNPSIEITFLKRVTILGAVREPKLYHIDATMTVAEALALAGGTLPEGMTNRIELVRDGRTVQILDERTRIGEAQIESGDRLYVPERSWPSRNAGIVAAIISGVASIAVALILK